MMGARGTFPATTPRRKAKPKAIQRLAPRTYARRYVMIADTASLDRMTEGYLTCALWSSTDDHGDPLDRGRCLNDLTSEARWLAMRDCRAFMERARDVLGDEGDHDHDPHQFGHDFWLTRNGHGTGFWDRSYYPQPILDALSEIARGFGGVDIYAHRDEVYMHGPPCIEHADCQANWDLGYACLIQAHKQARRGRGRAA